MAILLSVAGVGLITYLTLVWFLADWMGLQGNQAIILRAALTLIGVAATGLLVWFLARRKAAQAANQATAAPGAPGSGLVGDVQFVLREANARLKGSANIRKGGKNLSDLPLVLLVGESGATKTTSVLQSGLDPELLSGQASQDGATIPTRAANVWLGADTLFVEAGGPVVNDASAWAKLVDLLRARGLANLLGRTAQSPRAVMLCVDAPTLASAQAAAITGLARKYNAALGEVAQRWGNRLPIYVLFTKMDQVPYFTDYARNLSSDQVTGVFGHTLPLAGVSGGAYNEQETRRLTDAFEYLFLSLADKRLEQLRRENDPVKLPNIYEFPREFRKLRDNAVRFLLDVGRPSQLRASAFLRGFYFIGVRPVVAEGLPDPMPAARPADVGATRIFSAGAAALAAQSMAARSSGSRRVPQWVFLRQFFTDVLLQDRAARGTSGANTRASGIRRWLLGLVSLLFVIWMIGATVSWFHNRALIERARSASQALRASAGAPLSLANLQQLDEIRQVTAQVNGYESNGPPLSYRWGLYPGYGLYEDVRTLYCRDLGRTLLGPARDGMETTLGRLPAVPGPNDDYERAFNTLKAYLMMTSNADKTEVPFLRDRLVAQSTGNRDLPPDQTSLVRAQFEFYSAERASGMCAAKADPDTVERARSHLWNYPLIDRTYRNIVNDVSRKHPGVRYLDPSGTGSVVDNYEVAGAYTRAGWGSMKQAMATLSSGESWVLGADRGTAVATSADLQQQIRQKYVNDYITQWKTYLEKGSVVPYANFPDAAKKLDGMTNSKSSLLALVCLASVNTAVENPDITKEFAAVQRLVPPATCTDKPIDAPAQQYMGALTNIAVRVADISKLPDTSNVTIDSANARIAARTTSQTLNLPTKIDKLLNDPIIYADALIDRQAPDALNGKGADFCHDASPVFGKFPFNPRAVDEVKIDDFQAFFAPNNGKLWKFYQESLQEVLVQNGNAFVPKSGAKIKVGAGFLSFMNKAAYISHMFYGTNPAKPSLAYLVQALQSPNVDSFTLAIHGKSMTAKGSGGQSQEFLWSGESDTVMLAPRTMVGPVTVAPYVGSWAIFKFLAAANRSSDNNTNFDYDLTNSAQFGKQTASQSTQATLRLRVTAGGNSMGNLAAGCVAKIVSSDGR